jgi:hypothetical protein
MPTTTNYSNRLIDLSLFPEKTSESPVNLGIRPIPLVITGKLKASQNYIRILLSDVGERKENKLFGSTLYSSFKTTNISFPVQIYQIFSSQNLLVLKWIKERYNDQTPLDERIEKVELINYGVQPGGQIILDIKLYTQAGETAEIHLPVKWQKT